MVLKKRGKRANQDLNNLEITTSGFETPRSVRMSKKARLDDRLDFGPRETSRNRFELPITPEATSSRKVWENERNRTENSFEAERIRNVYPRMEESDPLTKFFNDMRSEKSYLNRSIRDYSGSADEFESWKRNTIEVLKYTTLDPLAQVGSVVAKLTGEATMLNVDNVKNPDELFELMARSFHRSASRILSSDCKQRILELSG